LAVQFSSSSERIKTLEGLLKASEERFQRFMDSQQQQQMEYRKTAAEYGSQSFTVPLLASYSFVGGVFWFLTRQAFAGSHCGPQEGLSYQAGGRGNVSLCHIYI
jgi:membrane protein insertase Oxa1/YidC/SpoIIIJ